MRITCPNCTAHFEIPSELLGRKGRSLKCANCGHSWYQTPQVETIDLAEIMGEEYAAKARADMGAPPKGHAQQQAAQQRQQAQQRGQVPPMQQQPGMQRRGPQGQPLPPGAQSMMRGGPAAVPPQRPPNQGAWGNQQRVQQVAAPWAQQAPLPGAMPVGGANPGWYQQQPPPGMQQGPPGQNPAWYQPQQPGMPPGGQNPPWAQQNAPGAAPMPMPGQTRLGTSLKPLGSLAIRSSPMAREWRPG